MSNISLAVYRNVFVLIVHTDDYEDGTRLQSKRATYKEIQTWVKQKYGFHVSNLSISQAKEKYGLAKTEYMSIRVMRVPRDIISLNCPRRKRQQFARHLSGLD